MAGDTAKATKAGQGTFYFDPEDGIYGDHFPGRPVVPGSLIVQAFLEAGKAAGNGPGPWVVENFRFRAFIAPGSYAYRLEPGEEGLRCLLYHEGQAAVSGFLRHEVAPAGS